MVPGVPPTLPIPAEYQQGRETPGAVTVRDDGGGVLPLALFVLRVRTANDKNDSLAADDATVLAHPLHRRANFHVGYSRSLHNNRRLESLRCCRSVNRQ